MDWQRYLFDGFERSAFRSFQSVGGSSFQ